MTDGMHGQTQPIGPALTTRLVQALVEHVRCVKLTELFAVFHACRAIARSTISPIIWV
jgi:hypothetical protein